MDILTDEPVRYRHELKYSISHTDYVLVRNRLKPVMRRDPYAGPEGIYEIHSLYFDNYRDKALREKLDGVSRREKFRLRYYNGDLSHIKLEKKMKQSSLCMKLACTVTPEQCRAITEGDITWMPSSGEPLLMEFYLKMKNELLRPRSVVSYKREPFIYAAGNVRVTFDSTLHARSGCCDFLELSSPAADAVHRGLVIMEVKYDDFLPEIISDLIQVGNRRVTAFSKYASCRQTIY